jgi:RHS repeat-associated protein
MTYTYDANGNVGQLINTNGTITAHYEYDPYGELVYSTGSESTNNVFRFSTKYLDVETDLYYYGRRFYRPGMGRWLNRDPIQERGGENLYCFVDNSPINRTDFLGLLVGRVKVNPWQPAVVDNFLSHVRGWLVGIEWMPPTSGDWAQPDKCKPCEKVIWVQEVAYGKGSPFEKDWGEADYDDYGYAWESAPGGKDRAAMFDQPDQHGGIVALFRSPYSFYARSYATCIMGKDAGTTYATVIWGFTWTYDTTPSGLGPIIR